MARIELADRGGSEVQRVWWTAPGLGESLQPLLKTLYDSQKLMLTPRVREAARMKIATINQCHVCLSHRVPEYGIAGVTEELYAHVDDPSHPEYSRRESLAIEYADRYGRSHLSIDEAFFATLRAEFSDPELAELTLLLSIWLGLGRMVRTLDLDHACSLEPAAF
jgi:alkylhydroperoxidase family enzyme